MRSTDVGVAGIDSRKPADSRLCPKPFAIRAIGSIEHRSGSRANGTLRPGCHPDFELALVPGRPIEPGFAGTGTFAPPSGRARPYAAGRVRITGTRAGAGHRALQGYSTGHRHRQANDQFPLLRRIGDARAGSLESPSRIFGAGTPPAAAREASAISDGASVPRHRRRRATRARATALCDNGSDRG